jgi:hypothetical protein
MTSEYYNKAYNLVTAIKELEKKNYFIENGPIPKTRKEIKQISIVIEGRDGEIRSIILPDNYKTDTLSRLNKIYLDLIQEFNKL